MTLAGSLPKYWNSFAIEMLLRRPACQGANLFLSCNFFHQPVSLINLPQRFQNPRGMDGDGARQLIGVGVIQHQRFNVPVKNDSYEFPLAIDHRAAGVASDDVGRAHEVEGG